MPVPRPAHPVNASRRRGPATPGRATAPAGDDAPDPARSVDRTSVRRLVVVLGDQLDAGSAAFDGFDPAADRVWMREVRAESTHVWSHRARTALFLSAMRHFRDSLAAAGRPVDYRDLDHPDNRHALDAELAASLAGLRPREVVMVEPGDWRVREALTATCRTAGVPLDIRTDRHFLCTVEEFADWARGRRTLRMEFFYRGMRRRLDVLMKRDGTPVGGRWNFDAENRDGFGTGGPGEVPEPVRFAPDALTREVLDAVRRHFPDHPGSLEEFDWPVTAEQAVTALADFVGNRLSRFGRTQDAMWTGRGVLFHSRLSAAMNLKLLDPRAVVAAVTAAHAAGRVGLPDAEGFLRQVIGWREYVRGVYWTRMPGYAEGNALAAEAPLPDFYWTGRTEMRCLGEVLGQTLRTGYAHHIQRLMVAGLYAMLLGVRPRLIHEWFLAIYVDAVEWVELPNVIGMGQFADGGLMASKPYAAGGGYIDRMSDYCRGCPYDPRKRTGPGACPFTTLYWDFLLRNRTRLAGNVRMALQLRNADRLSDAEKEAIRESAARHREAVCAKAGAGGAAGVDVRAGDPTGGRSGS